MYLFIYLITSEFKVRSNYRSLRRDSSVKLGRYQDYLQLQRKWCYLRDEARRVFGNQGSQNNSNRSYCNLLSLKMFIIYVCADFFSFRTNTLFSLFSYFMPTPKLNIYLT